MQGSFSWKIMPNIEPTDFQRAIYVYRYNTFDDKPDYINSFRTKLNLITGGFIFMLSLIQYFDIDREPDDSITVYCNNFSALCQVDTPVCKRNIRHHLIPEYSLVNELQRCIEKLRLDADSNHSKGNQ